MVVSERDTQTAAAAIAVVSVLATAHSAQLALVAVENLLPFGLIVEKLAFVTEIPSEEQSALFTSLLHILFMLAP